MTETRSPVVTVTLVILGILFLAPGACGAFFFGAILAEWTASGFTLARGELDLSPGIAGLSSISLLGSVFLLGLLVRSSHWAIAPTLSLILAIIAAVVSILSGLVLVGRASNPMEMVHLGLFVLAGLLFGAGVPLQFWLKNRAGQKNQETS